MGDRHVWDVTIRQRRRRWWQSTPPVWVATIVPPAGWYLCELVTLTVTSADRDGVERLARDLVASETAGGGGRPWVRVVDR